MSVPHGGSACQSAANGPAEALILQVGVAGPVSQCCRVVRLRVGRHEQRGGPWVSVPHFDLPKMSKLAIRAIAACLTLAVLFVSCGGNNESDLGDLIEAAGGDDGGGGTINAGGIATVMRLWRGVAP